MADIKISQLGAAVAVTDADIIPATANGVTVKVPASVLKEYAIGGTDISSIGDGTPTGAISALKSVKIEKTDIAPIETSVTSKAYAVGDQLYYNGMLYSVIAAIAQGENLVVDTNIELSDKVTEQIKALQGSVDLVNADLQKEVTTRAALGAKNLLEYPYANSTTVENGITFTDNGDGTVNVSGTASDNTFFSCRSFDQTLKKGSYIVSGCPNGGDVSSYFIYFRAKINGVTTDYNLVEETVIDLSADATIGYLIYVKSGTVISSAVTFKPMIRLDTDADPTYKPYAKTNRELTELAFIHTNSILNDITPGTNVTIQTKYGYKHGNHVHLEISCVCSTVAPSTTDFFTIPDELEPYLTKTVGHVVISNEHIFAGSFTFVQNANGWGARQGVTGSIPANTPITFIGDWYTN